MLERQVCMYKERISYHESVEEEHKKNLEQQVDVILKMEEERLLLLREHKESAEKQEEMDQARVEWETERTDLTSKNGTLVKQVALFETELGTLREEVKNSKEQMQREQEKAALAIEKANRRRPAVTSAATAAKKSAALKFNRPSEQSNTAGQQAAIDNKT